MNIERIENRLSLEVGEVPKLSLYGIVYDKRPLDAMDGASYITPEEVQKALEEVEGDELEVHINSYGGSMFAGVAIFNTLRNSKKRITVYIDGIAASSASLIAMAGDVVKMPENTQMMIHRSMCYGFGNADALRKTADALEKLDNDVVINTYVTRAKIGKDQLLNLIDRETWLSAKEAKAIGLCDEVLEFKQEEEEEKQEATEEVAEVKNYLLEFAKIKF